MEGSGEIEEEKEGERKVSRGAWRMIRGAEEGECSGAPGCRGGDRRGGGESRAPGIPEVSEPHFLNVRRGKIYYSRCWEDGGALWLPFPGLENSAVCSARCTSDLTDFHSPVKQEGISMISFAGEQGCDLLTVPMSAVPLSYLILNAGFRTQRTKQWGPQPSIFPSGWGGS